MYLFFQPDITEHGLLSEEESKHCVRVLRMKEGDTVFITDGAGNLFHGRIQKADPKACLVRIEKREVKETDKKFRIHIAVAPVKSSDRIEWFVEKATELGIDEISFPICEHSERVKVNMERLRKVAISAMKQSLRTRLPILTDQHGFSNFIVAPRKGEDRFIAVSSETTDTLFKITAPQRNYCVLIGPEGGFSEREIKSAQQHGFTPVSLGSYRLRTETAALAACHTLNLINGH